MAVPSDHCDDYETLLSLCTDHGGVLTLLQHYRPYLETIPSLRRPQDSMVVLPLPNIRLSETPEASSGQGGAMVNLPCDVAIIMCDPEWKITTETEILVFIHRPPEDFSQLLRRWRQTQILLHQGYEWVMPHRYQHLIGTGSGRGHPLFVVFPETPSRISRGLGGAGLPTVRFPFQPSQVNPRQGQDDHHWQDLPALEDSDRSRLGDGSQDG